MDNYFLQVAERDLKNLIEGEAIVQKMYNEEEDFEKSEALLEVLMACTYQKKKIKENIEVYKKQSKQGW